MRRGAIAVALLAGIVLIDVAASRRNDRSAEPLRQLDAVQQGRAADRTPPAPGQPQLDAPNDIARVAALTKSALAAGEWTHAHHDEWSELRTRLSADVLRKHRRTLTRAINRQRLSIGPGRSPY